MAKAPVDIRSLARTHTETCIRVLAGIVRSTKAADSARVGAAEALLNRGWGKPTQPLSGDGENPVIVQLIERVIRRPNAEN